MTLRGLGATPDESRCPMYGTRAVSLPNLTRCGGRLPSPLGVLPVLPCLTFRPRHFLRPAGAKRWCAGLHLAFLLLVPCSHTVSQPTPSHTLLGIPTALGDPNVLMFDLTAAPASRQEKGPVLRTWGWQGVGCF